MTTAILTSPLDVLRTRLQTDFYRSELHRHSRLAFFQHLRETLQILGSTHRIEGWRGLFRGLGPSLTGVVPATAVKFYTYGNCKRLLPGALGCDKDAVVIHVTAAATTGIVTATMTNPIWLIKTRLQLDRSRAEGKVGGGYHASARRYRNSWDCVQQVLQQEGIRGLYRGLSASYLGAVETTLHLTLYEHIKAVLIPRRAASGSTEKEMPIGRATDWIGTCSAAGASKLLAV